jgi:D-beta-D-heptose 7-phosphate kinase/D-beta-D-heptose 1-phosphate adenosyltransferase
VSIDRALLDRFREMKVLVIGEGMLDRYHYGTTDRLCREAPVPVVALQQTVEAPGAAANVAANIAALGAKTALITTLGADDAGISLMHHLNAAHVDVSFVTLDRQRTTLTKERVIAGHHMLLRLDRGSTDVIGCESELRMQEAIRSTLSSCDAVVVSDYAYGILTPAVIETLREQLSLCPKPLLIDAKDLARYRDLHPTAVKPNYAEAAGLLGTPEETAPASRAAQLRAGTGTLLSLTGASMIAVSLDQDGALLLRSDAIPHRVVERAAPAARGAGAGDCFLAAMALALAAGTSPEEAAELATTAAAMGVDGQGTALCSAERLDAALSPRPAKVMNVDELSSRVEALRREGNRIVFTNGCFDIVHRGHTTFLEEARALGDVLIVGLNSDNSVRQLKGPSRPVNGFSDRAEVLAALASVDFVVPFDEPLPNSLIESLRPHIFVKGGDYTPDALPEAALVQRLGGIVRILGYLPDHSTTGIIEKISPAKDLQAEVA